MLRHNKKLVIIALVLPLLYGIFYALFFRLNSSNCTSAEQYDALHGTCYYNCDTDQDCADKAAKVGAELNAYFEGSTSKLSKQGHNQQSAQDPTVNQTDDAKLITREFTGSETAGTIYTVGANQLLRPKPTSADDQLWNLFVRIAGKEDVRKYVQSFEVFNDPNNDSAASVWVSQTSGKWHVNVNATYQEDKKDLIHTMVHEYGHIVSLNDSQVPTVHGACPHLTLPEGCANAHSYIQTFYTQFWQKYGDGAPSNMGENQSEVEKFYQSHADNFISDYAATNYGEDWAESWAAFITAPKPNGGREKDAKIRFYYNYPELVSIRDRIRVQLASYNAQSK